MSHVIRVDSEVYQAVLDAKARLELATGRVQSMSEAIAFLIALNAW